MRQFSLWTALDSPQRSGSAFSALAVVLTAHFAAEAAVGAAATAAPASVKITDTDIGLLFGDCPSPDQHLLLNPANKAMLAPIVFHGRLLAKWQDESRNLLVKLRVHKILKEDFTAGEQERVRNLTNGVVDEDSWRRRRRDPRNRPPPTSPQLHEMADVVVALLREGSHLSSDHGPCPITLETKQAASLVTNGRYLIYVAPLWGVWANRLPRANFSAVALPDPFSRRASRTIHKSLCDDCGK